MDLDLRKLRYFAAVAEHRHFGRAAAQLHIAQPVLSRQIAAFERELGCALLTRTTRSVELTAAGEQLREEAQRLLAATDAALLRVQDADRGTRRLVLAFSPGLRVSEVLRAFADRRPDIATDVLPAPWWEPDAPLRDGRAQLGYLRRPFDGTGMRTAAVGREGRVACLPAGHPLAGRAQLVSADLDGEEMLDPARRRAGLEEKFERIASGHGIALVPLSIARSYRRPDVVDIPVADAPGLDTCLVVPDGRNEKPLRDFLETAEAVLRRG